jgi:hypothetical protein
LQAKPFLKNNMEAKNEYRQKPEQKQDQKDAGYHKTG